MYCIYPATFRETFKARFPYFHSLLFQSFCSYSIPFPVFLPVSPAAASVLQPFSRDRDDDPGFDSSQCKIISQTLTFASSWLWRFLLLCPSLPVLPEGWGQLSADTSLDAYPLPCFQNLQYRHTFPVEEVIAIHWGLKLISYVFTREPSRAWRRGAELEKLEAKNSLTCMHE